MQTWVILSLLSAFSLATSDALTKKVIHAGNEYVIGWYRLVYALPFLSFTPLFLLLFSRIVPGEAASSAGIAGIALIVLGGYALNLSSLRTGVLEPFKAVVRDGDSGTGSSSPSSTASPWSWENLPSSTRRRRSSARPIMVRWSSAFSPSSSCGRGGRPSARLSGPAPVQPCCPGNSTRRQSRISMR